MNKKEFNPRIKLDIINMISAVNELVSAYFSADQTDGEVLYTPYFEEIARISVFQKYFLDDDGESRGQHPEAFYTDLVSNQDFMYCYEESCLQNPGFQEVIKYADDIISFKKTQLANKSSMDSLLESLNRVLKRVEKAIDEEGLSPALLQLSSFMNEYQQKNNENAGMTTNIEGRD